MDLPDMDLVPMERLLLERSFDTDITRRRMRMIVVSAVLLAGALIVLSPLIESWTFLLFFAVAYIAVTTWERLGYARTILTYKALIRKLAARVDELEAEV